MSVNAWTPATNQIKQPEQQQLLDFIDLASDPNKLEKLKEHLSAESVEKNAYLMKLPQEQWQMALSEFKNDELQALLKFFTLAEMQLPGWEAGESNPVIWIVKILRKRNAAPAKDLLIWIRQNSNNRFLPNGPL